MACSTCTLRRKLGAHRGGIGVYSCRSNHLVCKNNPKNEGREMKGNPPGRIIAERNDKAPIGVSTLERGHISLSRCDVHTVSLK
jgi:hypothetical protein